MNEHERQSAAPPPGLAIGDIYYILFRHKWLISAFAALGVLAAAVIYFAVPTMYQSQAKLLVRYVLENRAMSGPVSDTQVRSPDSRGENVLNSEIEILTSRDLAEQVVDALGADTILAKAGGGTNRNQAVGLILKGLQVDNPKRSDVLVITFQHPDPTIVQPVVRQVVDGYIKRHVDIHRPTGILDDVLARQTDSIKVSLTQTSEDLRKAKAQAGVVSLDDSQKALTDEMSKLRQELFDTQAELASHQAAAAELQKLTAARSASNTATNAAAAGHSSTNLASGATTASNLTAAALVTPIVPPDKVDAYRAVASQLNTARGREIELLAHYTEANPLVLQIRRQIADAQSAKRQMEQENPGLVAYSTPVTTGGGGLPSAGGVEARQGQPDPYTEQAQIAALQAKISILTNQLAEVKAQATNLNDSEATIRRLQRKLDLDEANYRYYSAGLEQARLDEAVGPGKVTNIGRVQEASPPGLAVSKKLKMLAMALAGGIGGGLGLAFVLEMFLDQSVKRPGEVEKLLRLPLFLTVPDMARNGHAHFFHRNGHPTYALPPATRSRNLQVAPGESSRNLQVASGESSRDLQPAPGESSRNLQPAPGESSRNLQVASESAAPDEPVRPEMAPWGPGHPLHLYYEALRDRLCMYFQLKNMTHKPKLVGITSSSNGAGVTTLASGLAASLSETGDGNVLLVDMNIADGAAVHPFHQGKPGCGLTEALEGPARNTALVQDKLYVVSASEANGKRVGIVPKRFTNLVPKFKASDYDFIIFDMPPVSQTSVTSKVAGLMDVVLMVIESEKSNREVVKRATALLAESGANVAAVLNRKRNYLPAKLRQDLS